MGPDIEWNVRDGDDQAIIAKTQPTVASRGRRWLIALSVFIGASLGALYMTIPQPPKVPAPTPTPIVPSPPIEPVIDREAHALADGDENTFMTLQDQIDGEWYRAQQAAFKPWGTPPGDRLYTILEQGYAATGRAWAEVTQWINNDTYVRETRFYRLRMTVAGPEWKRARPDPTFWSGAQWTGSSTHFDIAYPAEDNRQAWRMTQRFERVYDVLCRDLNCPRTSRVLRSALIFKPDQATPLIDANDGLTITLPSPRLLEFHEPYGTADDIATTLAYRSLLELSMRQASSDADRWNTNRAGGLILQGLMAWETLRIQLARVTPPEQTFINAPGELWSDLSQGDSAATQQFYRDLLRDAQLVSLPELWYWPSDANIPSDQLDMIDGEIDALIAYLEEVHQPIGVVKFLNGIGKAKSLSEAIETALGVKYDELESQWLKWIGRRD